MRSIGCISVQDGFIEQTRFTRGFAVAVHRFTDKWVQSLALIPESGRVEFVDAICPGLHLRVTAKGTRTFSAMVRVGSHLQRRTIGKFPRVSLGQAREVALAMLREADDGIGSMQAKAMLASSMTLQQLVDAYVQKHLKPNARSWEQIRAALLGSKRTPSRLNHLLARPVASIAKGEIIELIDKVMAEGRPQAAVNLLRYWKMLINWGVDRDILPANIFERIRPPARTRERDRVLTEKEIVAVWNASFKLMVPYGQMYRMFMLTGQRRSEVARMQWHEIEGGIWTIPREKVKMDRPHAVPLTKTALATIATLRCHAPDAFVFSTTGGESASSNYHKVKLEIHHLSGTAGWTIHDLRRTVRSRLAELRVPRDVAQKIMNHASGKLDRIYNRHEYLDEKREALERWETRLKAIIISQTGYRSDS
jgi:integrase